MNYEMVEVELLMERKFIIETLERVGIANKRDRILFPSCYLYQKDDKFYIVHFKQLFKIFRDHGFNNMSEDDFIRRNSIIFQLKTWGMIDCDDNLIKDHEMYVHVVPHKEKSEWKIEHKFNRKLFKLNK